MQFQKDKGKDVFALVKSESKVNIITPAYAAQLGLKVQKIDIGAQKIAGFSVEIFNMVIAAFQVFDKLHHSWFL